MSTNDQDYKTGMLQGGAPFNAAPEQPAVPVNSKSQFRRITAQGGNPVMAPSAQAQDGLVEELRAWRRVNATEHSPTARLINQTISRIAAQATDLDMREEVIAALKHDIERSTATNAELASEIAELKERIGVIERSESWDNWAEYPDTFERWRTRANDYRFAHERQLKRAKRAEAELGGLREAAENVLWFDWSDNDSDAVDTLKALQQAVDAAKTAGGEG